MGLLKKSGGAASVLAALMIAVPASAAELAKPPTAAERPDPPSAAAFRTETRELLARPGFDASPGAVLRAPIPPGNRIDGAVLPENRVVAIYGAPQLVNTALGYKSPAAAARLAVRQSRSYAARGERPVIPAFDLIGVVANSTAGRDGLYRTRQPDDLIAGYLRRVRAVGGRLMIDIQPGRSPIAEEINFLKKWIAEPDVDVAIDPEWNVGRRGVPGRTRGSVTASEINAASRQIQRIVAKGDLPPKLLVVHQFTKSSIRKRKSVKQRREVGVTLNFDGIGSPAPKVAGYEALSSKKLFNGFSLFYRLDTPLMNPSSVLRLDPAVDFLLYQ